MEGDSAIVAKSECFPGNLILSLQRLRHDGKFCDVTIKCDDNEFKAHKTVLASATEYFQAMFSNETMEARTGIVDFSHTSVDVVKQSLDFIYSGKVEISESTAREMLNFSEMTQIHELARLCVVFVAESIRMENCSEMIVLSNLHCKDLLSEKIGVFLSKNFREFFETDAFKSLDIDCVLHCMDLLRVTASGRMCETQKWDGVLSWINYKPEQRKDQLFNLFKTVDLSCLTRDFLKENILSQPLITESKECLALIAVSSVFDQLCSTTKDENFKGFLFVCDASQMIARYEVKSGEWLPSVAFPGEFSTQMDVICHRGCIYVGDGARLHQYRDGKWNVTTPEPHSSGHTPNPCYCRCVGIGNSVFMVTHQYVYQYVTADLTLKLHKLPEGLTGDFFITAYRDGIYIMNCGDKAFVFDLSTTSCSRICPITNWKNGFAFWYDHRMYLFHFNSITDASNRCFVYDPKIDRYTLIPVLNTTGLAMNYYITDKLYLIGESPEDIHGAIDLEYLKSIKVEMKGKRCTAITN